LHPSFAVPTLTRFAPTWPPQSAQECWSHHRCRGNFIKAWGGSSPCGSGRVMPQSYGARCEGIKRSTLHERRAFPARIVILDVCRIELGPSRRDPQGTLQNRNRSGDTQNVLQGASAMGSSVVTRRVSRRVTAFGVRVATRPAHANRACMQSASLLDAACTHASNHRRQDQSTRRCSLHGVRIRRQRARTHGACEPCMHAVRRSIPIAGLCVCL